MLWVFQNAPQSSKKWSLYITFTGKTPWWHGVPQFQEPPRWAACITLDWTFLKWIDLVPSWKYQTTMSKSLGHTPFYKHVFFLAISFHLTPNSACKTRCQPFSRKLSPRDESWRWIIHNTTSRYSNMARWKMPHSRTIFPFNPINRGSSIAMVLISAEEKWSHPGGVGIC